MRLFSRLVIQQKGRLLLSTIILIFLSKDSQQKGSQPIRCSLSQLILITRQIFISTSSFSLYILYLIFYFIINSLIYQLLYFQFRQPFTLYLVYKQIYIKSLLFSQSSLYFILQQNFYSTTTTTIYSFIISLFSIFIITCFYISRLVIALIGSLLFQLLTYLFSNMPIVIFFKLFSVN